MPDTCATCKAPVIHAKKAVSRAPVRLNAEPAEHDDGRFTVEQIHGETIALNPRLFDGDIDTYDEHRCP